MAITSAVLTVIGTGVGIAKSRQAARKQERAERLSARQNDIENQRRIRAAVEAARVAKAGAIASAVAGGVGDTSALEGGLGAAQTQLASDAAFAQQAAEQNARSNRLIGSANRDLSTASTAQALGLS